MKDLITETFIPPSEKDKDDPVSYEIKPLTEMQLAELLMDHAKTTEFGGLKLTSKGAEKCLAYGLVKIEDVKRMKAVHIISVSSRIFEKAILTQDEEKN